MYKKILVAVDGSPCSNVALDESLRMASGLGAELVIVNVIDNGYLKYDLGYVDMSEVRAGLIQSGQELLAEAQAKADAKHVRAHTVLVDEILAMGDIARELEQVVESTQAELVVLGTHGRRGLRRMLLGSVAEGLVRQCKVPVLLVRTPPEAGEGNEEGNEEGK